MKSENIRTSHVRNEYVPQQNHRRTERGPQTQSMPVRGGLVANGLGTAGTEKPPKPRPPGGGLVALAAAAVAEDGVGGGAPELNSAQRGHLRFVFMCPIWPQ